MRQIIYLSFTLILTGCFSSALLNQEIGIDRYYANYYNDLLEDNSTLITARYTFTVERVSPTQYIKKVYFPETKQLTHLSTYSDAKLTVLNGVIKRYFDDGSQTMEGYYTNGKQSGEWKEFNAFSTNNYLADYGIYVNGQKEGAWTSLDSLGNISGEYLYANDQLNGAFTVYNEDGSVKETGVFKNDEKIESSIKEEEQLESTEDIKIVERMPYFPSKECSVLPDSLQKQCSDRKMLEYIYRNIKYPQKARNEGTQGMAVVRFVVDKTGAVTNTKCLNCICQPIKEEVLRLVDSFPNWIPGEQRGKKVNVSFNLPIRFRLE